MARNYLVCDALCRLATSDVPVIDLITSLYNRYHQSTLTNSVAIPKLAFSKSLVRVVFTVLLSSQDIVFKVNREVVPPVTCLQYLEIMKAIWQDTKEAALEDSDLEELCQCVLKVPLADISVMISHDYYINWLGLRYLPELTRSDEKLQLLRYVISSGFTGCTQSFLSKELDIPSKNLFQIFKLLIRYLIVHKETLTVDKNNMADAYSKNNKSVGFTTVIWFRNLFTWDILYKLNPYFQHLKHSDGFKTLGTFLLTLISQNTNQILIERDVKRKFSAHYHQLFSDSNISAKIILSLYRNLVEELIKSGQLCSVTALSNESNTYERCLAIPSILTNTTVSEISKGVYFVRSLAAAETPTASVGNLESEQSCDVSYSASSGSPYRYPKDDEEDEELPCMPSEQKLTWYNALNPVFRCYYMLAERGEKGIAMTALCDAINYDQKRFYGCITLLEDQNFVAKEAFREGKIFYYNITLKRFAQTRYDEPVAVSSANLEIEKIEKKATVQKTKTVQFSQRVIQMAEWIIERQYLTIPEICRMFAQKENTKNGIDRKTVLRLYESLQQNPKYQHIRSGQSNPTGGAKCAFYYDSNQIPSEQEASENVMNGIKEKRSQSCRDVFYKNKSLINALCGGPVPNSDNGATYSIVASVGKQTGGSTGDHLILDNTMVSVTSKQTKGEKFDQRIQSYYGFIHPLMIRLKILHEWLIAKSLDEEWQDGFVIRRLINALPLDIYLAVIGCGHRSQFVDDYVCNRLDLTAPPVLGSLDEKTQMGLLNANSVSKFLGSTINSVHKLFSRLRQLGLIGIETVQHGTTEPTSELFDEVPRDICGNTVDEIPPGSMVSCKWILNKSVTLSLFSLDQNITYHIPNDYDCYWDTLKSECIAWEKRHSSCSSAKDVTLPEGFELREAFISRNWKGTSMITPKMREQILNVIEDTKHDYDVDRLVFRSGANVTINLNSPVLKLISSRTGLAKQVIVGVLNREYLIESQSTNVYAKNLSEYKYRCHICQLYYNQKPSLFKHYSSVHNFYPPEDSSVYTQHDASQTGVENIRSPSIDIDYIASRIDAHVASTRIPRHSDNTPWYRLFLRGHPEALLSVKEMLVSLPQKDLKVLTQFSVNTFDLDSPLEEHDGYYDLGTTSIALAEYFRLTHEDIFYLHKAINSLRRDSCYILTARLVIAERMAISSSKQVESVEDRLETISMRSNTIFYMIRLYWQHYRFSPTAWIIFLSFVYTRFMATSGMRLMRAFRTFPASELWGYAYSGNFPEKIAMNLPRSWSMHVPLVGSEYDRSRPKYLHGIQLISIYVSDLMTPLSRKRPYTAPQGLDVQRFLNVITEYLCESGIILRSKQRLVSLINRLLSGTESPDYMMNCFTTQFLNCIFGKITTYEETYERHQALLSSLISLYRNPRGAIQTNEISGIAVQNFLNLLSEGSISLSYKWNKKTNRDLKEGIRETGISIPNISIYTVASYVNDNFTKIKDQLQHNNLSQDHVPSVPLSEELKIDAQNKAYRHSSCPSQSRSSSQSQSEDAHFIEPERPIHDLESISEFISRPGSLVQHAMIPAIRDDPQCDSTIDNLIDERSATLYSSSDDDSEDDYFSQMRPYFNIDPNASTSDSMVPVSQNSGIRLHLSKLNTTAPDLETYQFEFNGIKKSNTTLRVLAHDLDMKSLLVSDNASLSQLYLPVSLSTLFGKRTLSEIFEADFNIKYVTDSLSTCDIESQLPDYSNKFYYVVGNLGSNLTVQLFLKYASEIYGSESRVFRLWTDNIDYKDGVVFSLLIFIHYQITLSKKSGIARTSLLSLVVEKLKTDYELEPESESINIDTVSTLLDLVLDLLILIGGVVQLFAHSHILYFIPSQSIDFLIPLRPYKRTIPSILPYTQKRKKDSSTASSADEKTLVNEAQIERDYREYISGGGIPAVDILESRKVVEELAQNGIITDIICKSDYIPFDIWRIFGPKPGILESYFNVNISESTVKRSLLIHEKQALAHYILHDKNNFGSIDRMRNLFASLRESLKDQPDKRDFFLFTKTEFLNPLYFVPSMFLCSDGRLNETFIAIYVSRIYQYVYENPLISLSSLHIRIGPIFNKSELYTLCRAMANENLITTMDHHDEHYFTVMNPFPY